MCRVIMFGFFQGYTAASKQAECAAWQVAQQGR